MPNLSGQHGFRFRVRHTASRIKNAVKSRLIIDWNHDPSRSVLLASSGRSGSTWVARIINYRNDHREIFEPFHTTQVLLFRHFRNRQYIRPDCEDPQYADPIRKVFEGSLRSVWTDCRNEKYFCRRRLIKAIRANLMLKWIRVQMPMVPIVLLLRHPCAVAFSRMAMGWRSWLDEMLSQEELVEDHLEPFAEQMRQVSDPFERYVWESCVENYVALRHLDQGDVHLAFYEEFCEHGPEEVGRLFAYLGWQPDERALAVLKKPSSQAMSHSAIISGGGLIHGWQNTLREEQIRRALQIAGRFGLDRIYGPGPMPDREAAAAILRQRQ